MRNARIAASKPTAKAYARTAGSTGRRVDERLILFEASRPQDETPTPKPIQVGTFSRGAAAAAIGAIVGGLLYCGMLWVLQYLPFRLLGLAAFSVIGACPGIGMAWVHEDDDGTLAGIVSGAFSIVSVLLGVYFFWVLLLPGVIKNHIEKYAPFEIRVSVVAAKIAEERITDEDLDPTMSDVEADDFINDVEAYVQNLPRSEVTDKWQEIMRTDENLNESLVNEIYKHVPLSRVFGVFEGLAMLIGFFAAYRVGSKGLVG